MHAMYINSKSLNKSLSNKKPLVQAKQPDSRASFASFYTAYCSFSCNLHIKHKDWYRYSKGEPKLQKKYSVQNYTNESSPFHYLDLRDIRIETQILHKTIKN